MIPKTDFNAFNDAERLLLWTALAFELTIAARETYVPQSDSVAEPAKLRTYNELLHRLCSHMAALQRRREGFSDEALEQVLFDIADHGGLTPQLERCVERAKFKAT